MSNDHKDYCTYMNTEPVFPLGSKVWGVGRTCDFCGDSRLLRAGVGSIEENNTSWVDIWEDGGRWDQVEQKYQTFWVILKKQRRDDVFGIVW